MTPACMHTVTRMLHAHACIVSLLASNPGVWAPKHLGLRLVLRCLSSVCLVYIATMKDFLQQKSSR